MAVVIDEVQVDVQEPRREQHGQGGGGAAAGGGGGGAAQQPPKPEEVARAQRTLVERAERVWAY
jgi:hypothetical protein